MIQEFRVISVIITGENISGSRITVNEKSDINHLKNVFRIKLDEEIRAVDGEKEYFCKVVSIDKKEIILEIEQIFEDRYSHKVKIDAALGILKNDKWILLFKNSQKSELIK